MSLIYNKDEYTAAKQHEYISHTCNGCGNVEMRRKRDIRAFIRRGKTNHLCKQCTREQCNITRQCVVCDITFKSKTYQKQKFCSSSCSATYNNSNRKNEVVKRECSNCETSITHKPKNSKFCSCKCSSEYRSKKIQNEYYNRIENGETVLCDNLESNNAKFKAYLIHKHGNKCMKCGWCEVNEHTQRVPIELEHKDGNCTNNTLDNLELLCPNCHSLTATYKGANTTYENGSPRYAIWKQYFKK